MIASRSKNFIFVRTRKVAGTSIEFALSRHCNDDDIIAPIRNDIERAKLGVWPRNFMRHPRLEDEYRAIVAAADPVRLLRAKIEMRREMVFWDHISAREIRDRIGFDFWNKAYKFSVIRNPYEFVASVIYFRMSERGVVPSRLRHLREFIPVFLKARRNIDVMSIDGNIAVDKVLRYESLRADLAELGAIVGFDISNDLPNFKTDIRPSIATAASVLSPWARRLISRRWKQEFEMFAYSPFKI